MVSLGHLVRGERRPVAGAVRHHLVRLIEAPVVPDLSQRPPHRLDVGVGERDVGVVEVDPEADPLGQASPLLDVAEDRLPTPLVELGDAVGLDLGLRGDAELLLHLELHREAMAVPAGLPRHAIAAHRAVPRVDVLEHPREHVVRPRLAVGRRRPLVEAPDLGVGPLGQRAVKDVALAPALEDSLLELGEGLPRVYGPEGHGRLILPSARWAAGFVFVSRRPRRRTAARSGPTGSPSTPLLSASSARRRNHRSRPGSPEGTSALPRRSRFRSPRRVAIRDGPWPRSRSSGSRGRRRPCHLARRCSRSCRACRPAPSRGRVGSTSGFPLAIALTAPVSMFTRKIFPTSSAR